MKPKRASTSFTMTRNDLQLDPEAAHLPDVRVKPIHCGSGSKANFRLALVDSSDKIYSLDSLEDELRTSGLNLRVPAIENILNILLDIVPKYIARTGHSLRIGNLVTLKPCVTGSLDDANAEPDPEKNWLEIHAVVSPALRHSLSKSKLVNVNRSRNRIENVIRSVSGSGRDEVDAINKIVVCGKELYVSVQSAADENVRGRVWVETTDGKRLGGCAVLVPTASTLTVKFVPDAPITEDCDARLVVETYATQKAFEADDKSAIVRYGRKVRVIANPT